MCCDNDPSTINAFLKDGEQLDKRIEKLNDKYDETLNITFTGELIRYTKTFNKTQRSKYGTGCDSFHKIVEYRGNLCYIPEKTNVSENVWNLYTKKTSLTNIVNLLKIRQRIKNIMTSAKIQPFCNKQIINLGVYNPKQQEILPRSFTERRICLLIHKNHFSVIWKTEKKNFHRCDQTIRKDFRIPNQPYY